MTRIRVTRDQIVPPDHTLGEFVQRILEQGWYYLLETYPVSPGEEFDADIDSDGVASYERGDRQWWFSLPGDYEVIEDD